MAMQRSAFPDFPGRPGLSPARSPLARGWAAPVRAHARLPRILLVADDGAIDEAYAQPLADAGHTVLRVRSGEQALSLLERDEADLVLLDVQLPGISGFQVCRQIRQRRDLPVVFLTEHATLPERLMAFDVGADDYIVRPAEVEEVERRIRAVLRRLRPGAGRDVIEGPAGIAVHIRPHEVRLREAVVPVTPKEFDLLRLLLERRGEVLTSDEISATIWGYETFGSRNFVEAHVSRLRAKLHDAGADCVVSTVRGVGYVVR